MPVCFADEREVLQIRLITFSVPRVVSPLEMFSSLPYNDKWQSDGAHNGGMSSSPEKLRNVVGHHFHFY